MEMKRFRLIFLLGCFSMISMASAQSAFYYCDKGGKNLVSDTPCESQSAKMIKKVAPEELYPISSGGKGLSDSERRRVQQIDNRLRDENRRHQRLMQKSAESYTKQQRDKKRICDNLYRQKERIAAQQRIRSTGKLNERYRTINDRLHEKGC